MNHRTTHANDAVATPAAPAEALTLAQRIGAACARCARDFTLAPALREQARPVHGSPVRLCPDCAPASEHPADHAAPLPGLADLQALRYYVEGQSDMLAQIHGHIEALRSGEDTGEDSETITVTAGETPLELTVGEARQLAFVLLTRVATARSRVVPQIPGR